MIVSRVGGADGTATEEKQAGSRPGNGNGKGDGERRRSKQRAIRGAADSWETLR
jgi:hypothetical protein